ncbi:HAMP domain-containing histidine kinase [Shewanella sp. 202IG2-18]|uniref:sensor histidine kinase n=1 Tax=Parashewanella hymeniacidonis TaxID=2807618 RepID=UPI0019604E9C|nr:HAMP domain-containing sensor histidine kinase [Parashewanella hymeniacidonis]MBM7072552.1 HAMP domain-containing histidine kinase [Parashewanella hymeniacidonis]
MSSRLLNYFNRRAALVIGIDTFILGLLASNLYLLFEDWLVVLTVIIIVGYILLYISLRALSRYKSNFDQLEAFMRMRAQGASNISLVFDEYDSPFKSLANLVANTQQVNTQLNSRFLETIFTSWPMPIVILNAQKQLIFFNQAFYQKINLPLIEGMSIDEIGFEIEAGLIRHSVFDESWQLKMFKFDSNYIVMAQSIADELQHNRFQVQQQLIRVLSHELNNSLTPMASLADTLLDLPELPQDTTRKALARIKDRSETLLTFVSSFKYSNNIPEATVKRLDLSRLVSKISNEYELDFVFQGESVLVADSILFERLMINLMKNAKEASATKLDISNFNEGSNQIVSITDNGKGFQNLQNTFTPLYTTKASGEGLGLFLCKEIVARHNGDISAVNVAQGAKISIKIPQPTTV